MRKSLLLWVVIFSLLSTFVIGCGGDDDDDDDDSTGPVTGTMAEFADTWYALAQKDVGGTTVYGFPMDMMILDIMEDAGNYLYSLEVNESTVDMGTCAWESRSNGNYVVFTSAIGGAAGEVKVSSFDDDRCLTVWQNEDNTQSEIVMVRSAGIYGIVTNGATSSPFANTTVSLAFQGTPIATAQTDAWGIYTFTSGLTEGNTYYVTASVDGFTDGNVAAMADEAYPVYAHMYLMEQGAETGTISGIISNSETGMAPGVNVNVSTDDGVSLISGDGTYVLRDVQNGTRTITATAEGYQTYTGTVIVAGGTVVHNISLTPETVAADLGTIAMSWTSTADFDLHMLTPEIGGTAYELYYNSSNRGSLTAVPFAQHQGDAMSGASSPEEIFFANVYDGTYLVWAERYSGSVFTGEGLQTRFEDENGNFLMAVTANYASGSGNYWIIAEINNGTVTPVNELTNEDPMGGSTPNPELADVDLLWLVTANVDLDLNILTPYIGGQTYRVYYGTPGDYYGPPYMEHQGDGRGSDGEENVLVNEWMDGTYTIYVKNYTTSTPINESLALLKIWNDEGTAEYIYASSASGYGNYWYVADVNGTTNQITVINRLQSDAPTAAKPYITYEEVMSK